MWDVGDGGGGGAVLEVFSRARGRSCVRALKFF